MKTIEEKLNELGYELPAAPTPGGNYLPWRRVGNVLHLAGVIAVQNGKMTHIGQVGESQTVESGYEAARICTLNALAAIKAAIGDFDKIRQFVMLSGYVNAVSGFAESPAVINGASDMLIGLFGDKGQHARAAVAVAGLPKNSTVELQMILEVAD